MGRLLLFTRSSTAGEESIFVLPIGDYDDNTDKMRVKISAIIKC